MTLVGVRVEVQSNSPIMLLREEHGPRYLPIFIGAPEATAIVWALEGVETPRPMTHDLFKAVLEDIGAHIERVVITHLADGTFYAELVVAIPGRVVSVSARPSDAIALAVRHGGSVPIVAAEGVLDAAGVLYEPGAEDAADEEAPDAGAAEEQIEEFREFLDQVTPEDFAGSGPSGP